jgi:tetratricopeptide (TPR) repeat protein
MFRMLKAAVALAALVALCQAGAVASGSRAPSPSSPAMSHEEVAVQAYNSGIDHRDKGTKLELQATTAAAKDRDKILDKAKKEYTNALKDFKRAADNSPKMYQAFNGMGYAYRKTGDYTKALEMYDKALSLAPGFPDALEYRGEAYLGLNRIDDAKQAYMTLFGSDPAQADVLMTAMKKWVEQRKADPAGVDPAAISAFEKWIQERGQLALLTAPMALNSHRTTW